MNPGKKAIYCHSGKSRARSEALALSSHFKKPLDSGFRRSDGIATFYSIIKTCYCIFYWTSREGSVLVIEYWNLRFICNLVLVIWDFMN
jgi:hypothetical protein